MLFPESDTILKSNPHIASEIIEFDKFLAITSSLTDIRIEYEYIKVKTGFKDNLLAKLLKLYKDIIVEQNWFYCKDCSSYLKKVESDTEFHCDECFKEISSTKNAYYFIKKYNSNSQISSKKIEKIVLMYAEFIKSFDGSKETSGDIKKHALENLCIEILDIVEGFEFSGKNVNTSSSEIDFIFKNKIAKHDSFVNEIGVLIPCECRNVSTSISSKEISAFGSKMKEIGAKFGVFFARTKFSGLHKKKELSNSKQKIKEEFKEGRMIIPISGEDLENISKGKNFLELLHEKYIEICCW